MCVFIYPNLGILIKDNTCLASIIIEELTCKKFRQISVASSSSEISEFHGLYKVTVNDGFLPCLLGMVRKQQRDKQL